MTRLFPSSSRLRAASGRLRAAETRFERSMTDLCRAALDHIDRQHLLGLVLQRLVAQRAGSS